MRIRTTNNRLIGFAYKPGDAEQQELVAAGQSTEKAADHQHFEVTPEGVELSERVGMYALNLYGAQMEAMGNGVREAVVAEVEVQAPGFNTNVDISGEEDAPVIVRGGPSMQCKVCGVVILGKTLAAAKGKLTRHTKKEHV